MNPQQPHNASVVGNNSCSSSPRGRMLSNHQQQAFQSYFQRTSPSTQQQQPASTTGMNPSTNNNNMFQQHYSASLNNQGFPEGANTTMLGHNIHKPGNPISSLELANANRVDLSIQQLLQLSTTNNNNNNTSITNNISASSALTGHHSSRNNNSPSSILMQQQHASLFQSMFNNTSAPTTSNNQMMVNNNNNIGTSSTTGFLNNTNNNNTMPTFNNNNNNTETMLRLLLNNPSLLGESPAIDLEYGMGNNINPSMQQTNFDTNIILSSENDNMGKDHTTTNNNTTTGTTTSQQQFNNTNHSDHFSFSDIFDIPHTMRSSSPLSSQTSSDVSSSSSMEKLESNANADEANPTSTEKKKSRKRSDSAGNQDEETTKRKRRSIKDRLMWSDELHQHFVQVVESLGVYDARPKEIKKIMNVDFLTTTHIKSHLQKYRSHLKKKAEQEGIQLPSLKRSIGSSSSLSKSKKETKRKKKNVEKEESNTSVPTTNVNASANTTVTGTNNSSQPQTTISAPPSIQNNVSSLVQPATASASTSSKLPPTISTNNGVANNNQLNRTNSPPGSSQLFDPQYLSNILSHLDKPLTTNTTIPQKVSSITASLQNLPPSPKSASTVLPLFVQQQRRNSEYSSNSNSISNHSQIQINNQMNNQLNNQMNNQMNNQLNQLNINFGIQPSILANNANNFQQRNENQLGFVNNNFVTLMDNSTSIHQQQIPHQQQNNGATRNSNPALGEYLTILRNICSSEKEFADLFQNIQSQIREARDMDLVVEGFRLGFLCGHRIKGNNNK